MVVFRPRPRPGAMTEAQAYDRWVKRKVEIVWALLFLNVLTWSPKVSIFPVPSSVGKVITQAVLPVALFVALTANRRVKLRPSVFLCLVSLLALEAVLTCLNAQYLRGTAYRTFRFGEFAATLWLLSPFWERRDMLLARAHLKVMMVVLGSVLIGLIVAPGHALANAGRLSGVLWPVPDTQVAHYAAVTLGMVLMLWFCGRLGGRKVLVICLLAAVILIMTKTRTALVGGLGGVIAGGLSLIVSSRRVTRFFLVAFGAVAVGALTSASAITAWLARGQSSTQLANLSGRTNFWGPILALPRDKFQEIFGFGLSNDTFDGLPIDSNWLDSYYNQGLFGITVCALILVFLYVAAAFQPHGIKRALAIFLTTYCLIASFTEVGFTGPSPYLLDVTVAASLLAPMAVNRAES
jgi:O-antigen ligase